jgi:hypothetical protein
MPPLRAFIIFMESQKRVKKQRIRGAMLAAVLLIASAAAFWLLPGGSRRRSSLTNIMPAAADAAGLSSWKQSARKVEEDRGEPMGLKAKVDVPAELRHYSDTRRFLAIQVAEWRKHRFETPKDFSDLASMIRKGEVVELKSVSENYILYGVGGRADGDQFTHYLEAERKSIPLISQPELEQEYARIDESRRSLEEETASAKRELESIARSERSRRAALQAQLSKKEKSLKEVEERKELLDTYYQGEPGQELSREYETLQSLAADFNGQTYDLMDAHARQQMKLRMLSFLRPEALKVLEELAASYKEKFGRPLPVTSLMRPDEYQNELSKVNPNATRIATPPHSTGLAFDILYKFMTAEEQSYVMGELARLEDAGRIEVLRENRNHYHVFAFIGGTRPEENFIRESMGGVAASAKEAAKESKAEVKESRERRVKSAVKEARTQPKVKAAKAKARRR